MTEVAEITERSTSERVIIAVRTPNDTWTRIGSVAPDEPPATFGHDITGFWTFIIGWMGGTGPLVWKTNDPGVVLDDHTVAVRADHLEVLADLTIGPTKLDITGRDGTATIRFTYQPE
jgi:hypothetical protein